MTIFGTQSEQNFATEVATAASEAEKAAPPAPESAPEPEAAAPPEQAAPPAEAAPKEPAAVAPEPKEEQKMVPLAALHKEREERQKLAQDFANLSEAMNRFQQQMQQQYQQPQEQPFDPLDTDASQDPFAVIQALQQRVRQFEEGSRAQLETEQVKTAYLGTIRQAVTADASFRDAYNHLVQSRIGELTAMGMNPVAANETIKQEELHLARTAFMNGRNPAEVIMGYAKARGYTPKAKEPPPPPPAEQVQKQAERAAAATSMSGGGKPPEADMSLADIANLKGAAFDSSWDKFAAKASKGSSLFRH